MQRSTDRTDALPALPCLEPGERYLLEREQGRETGALHALVVDHVLTHEGPAVWVDAAGNAVTASIRELAPSDRVLERMCVARGFTPYQHTSILRALREWLQHHAPSLVVAPALDAQYRSDDLRGETGETMLLAALADIARATRHTDAPLLLTRRRGDDFARPVEEFATATLTYRETAHGPRFLGDDTETHVYHLGNGWVQTTLAFWQEVLAARQPLYEQTPTPTVEVANGAH